MDENDDEVVCNGTGNGSGDAIAKLFGIVLISSNSKASRLAMDEEPQACHKVEQSRLPGEFVWLERTFREWRFGGRIENTNSYVE